MIDNVITTLANKVPETIDAIGNTFDKLFTSDDERNQAKIILEKLKQHPNELVDELKKFVIEKEFEDRESARDREIQVKDWVPKFLSVSVTLGFFGILFFCMIDNTLSSPYETIMKIMIGSLGTAWISIITYYFGSSSSSASKDEILAKYFDRIK